MKFQILLISSLLSLSPASFGSTISNCDYSAQRIVQAVQLIEDGQTNLDSFEYRFWTAYDSADGYLYYEVKATAPKVTSDSSFTSYKVYKFKLKPASCTLVGDLGEVVVEQVM